MSHSLVILLSFVSLVEFRCPSWAPVWARYAQYRVPLDAGPRSTGAHGSTRRAPAPLSPWDQHQAPQPRASCDRTAVGAPWVCRASFVPRTSGRYSVVRDDSSLLNRSLVHRPAGTLLPPLPTPLTAETRSRGAPGSAAAQLRPLPARSMCAQYRAPMVSDGSKPIRYFHLGCIAHGPGPRSWPRDVVTARLGGAYRCFLRFWPHGITRCTLQTTSCVTEPHILTWGFSGGSGLRF
ncbi:hypothetical protein NDU88_001324 [Pleurodeles waltl]|uniref:Secreted protein n=1 Tax=Pleurodeles waltl TaxID=8319 RepID=A0AAV7U6J5_PLEWA|nr:hypothetical protein NDU88_001324 [Pleurodeles waltl]